MTPLSELLTNDHRRFLEALALKYRFTFQERQQLETMARDLEMTRRGTLEKFWREAEAGISENTSGPQRRKAIFRRLAEAIQELKDAPVRFEGSPEPPRRTPLRPVVQASDKKIAGDCPVASPETVCCNLKTIDAVENCSFGCSYCTIQTFYGDEAVFDQDFASKLKNIPIDPSRLYHYGSGQSSDSLIWGNRNGNLDALCGWARAHPNVLLEFKTKSANIGYFLEREVPVNLVISWSLNPQMVIEQEEHFTARLDERLAAARRAADHGIAIAFHFHPIFHYEGGEKDYPELARRVQSLFRPEEVYFISFGSLTFIKPVMRAIREKGGKTQVLGTSLVPDAHGKLSYPEPLKVELFRRMHEAFAPWQDKVFRYLCMERAAIWDQVWGWHYPDNETFERDFLTRVFQKRGIMPGFVLNPA